MIEHVNELAIVFVSSDQDDVIYKEYYASMPWFSLPYEKQQTTVHALGKLRPMLRYVYTRFTSVYIYCCQLVLSYYTLT